MTLSNDLHKGYVMAKTTKQNIRAKRQEDHRARLSEGQHLRYVIENIDKIQKLKPSKTSTFQLAKLKTATELSLRLVSKFLPDLKAMELTGEGGGPMQFEEWLDELDNPKE